MLTDDDHVGNKSSTDGYVLGRAKKGPGLSRLMGRVLCACVHDVIV